MQDPQPDFRPVPGASEALAHDLRRIVAPNPSPMTFRGTNTYLLGTRGLAVIDPGPEIPAHLEAILRAVGPEQRITHILVTHAHTDHSPLARPLSEATGAPVLAFGHARAGRSEIMERLAASGLAGGGEGVHAAFAPDETLPDGANVVGDGWRVEALHTPGHFCNHLAFAEGGRLFTGDLVMGWASSLVSPPDGDLTAFMTSLERLATRTWHVFLPGHGAPVETPAARLAALLAHRRARETAILQHLETGPGDARTLAARIYTDTPAALQPAAARNVFSHLIDLTLRNRVHPAGEISENTLFTVC